MKTTYKQNLIAAALVGALVLPALAQTDSSFYRPLTLAAADEPAGGGGGGQAKEDEAKGGLSAEELAKIAQNPVANMISVPFQNNFNFDVGPNKVTQYIMNFQPVIPISLNAQHRDMWTVPVGGGIGRIVKLGGKLPVNFKLAAYDNVCTPRNGASWQLQFQIQFLLPKALFTKD